MDAVIRQCFERADRTRFLTERYADFLGPKLLDVACDRAILRELRPDLDYTGIDIAGTPDLQINLEEADRLPFDDGAFDTVVATDVLEHLDNLHHIFDEIVRVAGRSVIISLPNNWANARRPIGRGRGGMKFYGLPAERPEDRHKWFFGLSEAADFARAQTDRLPLRVADMVAVERPRPWFVRALRHIRYRRTTYLNRYAHTLFVAFEKTGVS